MNSFLAFKDLSGFNHIVSPGRQVTEVLLQGIGSQLPNWVKGQDLIGQVRYLLKINMMEDGDT